jgi:hypothetical protein
MVKKSTISATFKLDTISCSKSMTYGGGSESRVGVTDLFGSGHSWKYLAERKAHPPAP